MRSTPKPLQLTAAALLLLLGSSPPVASSPSLVAEGPDTTAEWVTVDASGRPATVTPVITPGVDGLATTVSAAPEELTATVVTRTESSLATTSTGTAAPAPTAGGEDEDGQGGEAGSYLVCNNADGLYFPFCEPAQNSSLYNGTTYYVTWDPSVFESPNTTVIVEGLYVNASSGEITSQAFTSPEIPAGRSHHAWAVDSSLLHIEEPDPDDPDYDPDDPGPSLESETVNITLVIRALAPHSNATAEVHPGPTVAVLDSRMLKVSPVYKETGVPRVPASAALYVGVPTVIGFCVLMLCGVCAWNRNARRIGLGNVMSRGRGRVGRRMAARRERKQGIRLGDDGAEGADGGGGEGARRETRDLGGEDLAARRHHQSVGSENDGWSQDCEREDEDDERHLKDLEHGIHVGIARRDSDALGSLAGTPTSENFPPMQQYERR